MDKGCPRISVANFRTIKEAEVTLRPLTVFLGPSNTGKSYLATLIYAMHNCISECGSSDNNRYQSEYSNLLQSLLPDDISKLKDALTSGHNQAGEGASDGIEIIEDRVPRRIIPLVRKIFPNQPMKNLNAEITRCFGSLDGAPFRNHDSTEGFHINVQTNVNVNDHPFQYELYMGMGTLKVESSIPENMLEAFGEYVLYEVGKLSDMHSAQSASRIVKEAGRFQPHIIDYYEDRLYSHLASPVFHFPPDRSSLLKLLNLLSANIMDSPLSNRESKNDHVGLSPLAFDFLRKLLVADIETRDKSSHAREIIEISEQIENEIMGGFLSIHKSDSMDAPDIRYVPKGWDQTLNLYNVSSTVAQLAPLVFHLRHSVEVGDVLIIEEPESHLHPSAQVTLTRHLIALVNAGVRVIITTHSEWIMEALANHVNLSSLPDATRKEIGAENDAINADRVGVWRFSIPEHSEGSRVEEIVLDDTRLYPTGYDEVATDLHNEWSRITSSMQPS